MTDDEFPGVWWENIATLAGTAFTKIR